MSANVRILRGPAGSGKTERLLDECRRRARAAPGTALWLGPTRRAVEAVRTRLLGDETAFWGARLSTFQEFLDSIIRCNDPQTRQLSGVQRRLLVEELLARLRERRRLAHFDRVLDTRGFLDGLLSLLAELQGCDIAPEDFARAAGQLGERRGKERQCALVYEAYCHELRRRRWHDLEGSARHAGELLRRGLRLPFPRVRAVFVDGFNDFARSQHEVLAQLCDRLDILWIALPDEPGDERAELFTRPRATFHALQLLAPVTEDLRRLDADPRPAGLRHLERQLFRPLRKIVVASDAAGVECVAAPGVLGETRLVARRVKRLLLDGAAPDDILMALRDLPPYADLIREVFDEYGIPLEMEGADALARNPAVAVLLRALRLPDDDWPFAGVTALLRHTYFRPLWPETADAPERPRQAEALLRLLGEPRGRAAYLAAVRRWADEPQPGLEDEEAEESRRQHIHKLAKQCAPFLQRFFHAWDDAPDDAPLADHLAWLSRFADDLGVTRSEDESDRAALRLFWDEAEAWRERDPAPRLDRKTFQRRLLALAGEAGLPRTDGGPGRVRVLSAKAARHLDAPVVFLMGLGERGFPQLAPPHALFEEQARQAFARAGVDLTAGDLLADEMLLFYQVVTRARRLLVLSYPAVDERGQALLPSSFLAAVLDCFAAGAVPCERRRMLIEGYDRDEPLSPAEYRVRAALAWRPRRPFDAALPDDLWANLADAAELTRLRFREKEHNPYDGRFRDPRVLGELRRQFGPDTLFSPTALEDYVACPFRFFLKHVLRLETLEEPSEEIEVTRRGQTVHRALARLHRKLKEEGVHEPTELVEERVRTELGNAVEEDVRRAPGPASKQLWRLEGERLLRAAARYGEHWRTFLTPWRERGVVPRPHHFEASFGLTCEDGQPALGPLVLRAEDGEVRVIGRIDRVDVAELADGVGFWVIDYKTGRAGHYTGNELADFRRLQLTLYALAVEEVLLAGQEARPLGLAYWQVPDKGPKVALPARHPALWLEDTQGWRAVREQLRAWVLTLVRHIRAGDFALQPRSEHCTQTCDFGQICRITQARPVGKSGLLPLPTVGEASDQLKP